MHSFIILGYKATILGDRIALTLNEIYCNYEQFCSPGTNLVTYIWKTLAQQNMAVIKHRIYGLRCISVQKYCD